MGKTSDAVKKALRRSEETPLVTPDKLLNTGSTLLNLGLTGTPTGGWLKGCYFFFVGVSKSGKTFLTLTSLAEACHNPQFKDYRLVYDNAEHGALMSIERFFGKKLASRIEPPKYDGKVPVYSAFIEELYFNLYDNLKNYEEPCIYILDSMDGLASLDQVDKFEENKTLYEKGKDLKGSYGDGKAKKNSQDIRTIIPLLRDTGSILIFISQTRQNITGYGRDKTRAGGDALRFYATAEIWADVIGSITKTVNGKERKIGSRIKLSVEKNRMTGKERQVVVSILDEMGIDDVGSLVDFMIDEKEWPKAKSGLISPSPLVKGEFYRDQLIRNIEKNELERDLRAEAARVWRDIEHSLVAGRKARYE